MGRAEGQRPPTADWRLSRVLHGFSRSLRNNAIVVSSFVPFRRFWSLCGYRIDIQLIVHAGRIHIATHFILQMRCDPRPRPTRAAGRPFILPLRRWGAPARGRARRATAVGRPRRAKSGLGATGCGAAHCAGAARRPSRGAMARAQVAAVAEWQLRWWPGGRALARPRRPRRCAHCRHAGCRPRPLGRGRRRRAALVPQPEGGGVRGMPGGCITTPPARRRRPPHPSRRR